MNRLQPIRSFPPVADERSRVLILGTMPGPESLRRGQYYGFASNAFWHVAAALFGPASGAPGGYEDRLALLARNRVALWDVLARCRRADSSDGSIRGPLPNDLPGLLARYPGIGAVFFNGQGAGRFFRRFFPDRVTVCSPEDMVKALRRAESGGPLPACVLPSTSPAAARLSRAQKLLRWRVVNDVLLALNQSAEAGRRARAGRSVS